jgi:serine/threonine-protein kinase
VIGQEPAPPSRLNDRIPNELEAICLKCLNKLPTLRYATAAELAEDLHRYLRTEPTLARSAARLMKWVQRNPWLATSLIGGVLLVTAIGAWMVSNHVIGSAIEVH